MALAHQGVVLKAIILQVVIITIRVMAREIQVVKTAIRVIAMETQVILSLHQYRVHIPEPAVAVENQVVTAIVRGPAVEVRMIPIHPQVKDRNLARALSMDLKMALAKGEGHWTLKIQVKILLVA